MCGSLGSVSNNIFPNNAETPANSAEQPPVCVLGLGLIGGSLLRDLQRAGWQAFGWNRSAGTVDAARGEGFDVSGELTDVLQRAEREGALIVLGVPVPALRGLLAEIAVHAPSCGLTDVTSVKTTVLDAVEAAGLAKNFVGGHPMAGTADSGWEATMTGLFDGAVWVVCHDNAEDDGTWIRTWTTVVNMARSVGSAVVPARAGKHDRAVARISHLPHILAEALSVAGDRGGSLALSLAASSFRDGTRVAGTDPLLVQAMCDNNAPALINAIDETIDLLGQARESLASGTGLESLVEEGFAARGRFEARAGRTQSDATNRPLFNVQPGKPGWLEQLDAAEQAGAELSII